MRTPREVRSAHQAEAGEFDGLRLARLFADVFVVATA
jgi:hypothetical protein